MNVGDLIRALEEVPDDIEIKVLTYGYSQGRRDKFDIDQIVIADERDHVTITVDE